MAWRHKEKSPKEMQVSSSVGIEGEFRRSWSALLAVTIGLGIGVHALPFYTAGTFMTPLSEEFGWSRANLSLGPTLLMFVLALTSPAVGWIMDRYGERWLILISLLSLGAFLALLGRMSGDIHSYWAIFAAVAFFGAGSGTSAFSRVISAEFVVRRGTALVLHLPVRGSRAPLIAEVVHEHGWRDAYTIMAVAVLIATPLVVLPLWRRTGPRTTDPKERDRSSSSAFREALATSTFWRLAIAFPLIGLATIGMVVHFVPLLVDSGVALDEAASLAGLIGISMIIARLVSGVLIDLFFAPFVGAAAMSFCAAGLLLLAIGDCSLAWTGGDRRRAGDRHRVRFDCLSGGPLVRAGGVRQSTESSMGLRCSEFLLPPSLMAIGRTWLELIGPP